MRIQNNITAMNTHRMYTSNNNAITKSAEKLSSGYRINRAGDDAAGLAISEKMRSQIRGLNMASKNSQDANSLIQTAEGALQEVHSMLQRMNELANQSATGTNQDFDRSQISAEFDQLKSEINDISKQTNFNNMKLLDGSLSSGSKPVDIKSGSLQVNASFGGGEFVVTAHNGLSKQVGTYSIANDDGTITVTFTDASGASSPTNGNVTNTTIKLEDVTSGSTVEGGAFTVDLSGAGLGVFEITNSAGGGTAIAWDDMGAAFVSTNALTTEKAAAASAGTGGLKIQVGANKGEQLTISVEKMDVTGLGLGSTSIATQESASSALEATQKAIDSVSEQRSLLGAMQNRLDHKISNLDNTSENLSAAESRIRDVDLAKEMTNFTKNQILSQAATAMLAQANAMPQNVLSLLQ